MAKAPKPTPARAAKPAAKRPRGRPTLYRPEMCAKVIELGREGASKAEMAAELGIGRETFTDYERAHPEFMRAVNEAVALAQAWWESRGRKAVFGGYEGFNATAFIFTMKNRFPADWRDKQDIEHSGPNGSALVVHIKKFDVEPS